MSETGSKVKGRGKGRPRKSGTVSRNQREDILKKAFELFQDRGYQNTSMVAIAKAVGLNQSSLYYWFESKNEILRAIVESNSAPLRSGREVARLSSSAAVQLYLLLYADTKSLCEFPFDYFTIEQLARSQRESFGEFFSRYDELMHLASDVVSLGVSQGAFSEGDPMACAALALAFDEGVQHRYHTSVAIREGRMEGIPHLDASADQVARASARGTVLSLLRDKGAFADVEREASELIPKLGASTDDGAL